LGVLRCVRAPHRSTHPHETKRNEKMGERRVLLLVVVSRGAPSADDVCVSPWHPPRRTRHVCGCAYVVVHDSTDEPRRTHTLTRLPSRPSRHSHRRKRGETAACGGAKCRRMTSVCLSRRVVCHPPNDPRRGSAGVDAHTSPPKLRRACPHTHTHTPLALFTPL
jgi:hypothetical protein